MKNDAEDLGSAVVKPTDSNPDATKKVKAVSGDAQQKNVVSYDQMPSVKKEEAKTTIFLTRRYPKRNETV